MVPVLIGVVCAALGVLLIWRRAAIARLHAAALRAVFGRQTERSAQNSTPGTITFTGAGAIIIGIVITANGLVRLSQ
jgi:ABC-type Mn2+/Zn2+ transport system permease subunit